MLLFLHLVNITVWPLALVGAIRKMKARMQCRRGAPISQPFFDVAKWLRKGEVISETTSWIFPLASRLGLAVSVVTALAVPWSGLPPLGGAAGMTDFLLILYLLTLGKFISLLAALDAGSAFGGLGASREATLTTLTEPILAVGLGALAVSARSSNLSAIFASPVSPLLATLVGAAFVIASLVELSRMPVDDPTTHLELTMVHEAMILENSGRSLALVELSTAIRTCVYLGLTVQTILLAWPFRLDTPLLARYILGLSLLFAAGISLAMAEGVLVKLNWRRMPNFVAFGWALSLLAAMVAAARI
jgi:formate hydrogenlyase subunit 4